MTKTTTIDVGTTSLHSIRRVVKTLGATIAHERRTPGAVGYTTITITQELHRERDWTRRALADDVETESAPEPSEADQLARLIREALDKVAAASYQRGRYTAGAAVTVHRGVLQAQADDATVALWRTFYELAPRLGESTES